MAATAAARSTANMASLALFPGPTDNVGYQTAKTTADEIMGVPLFADPATPFPQFYTNDKTHYMHSVPQCYIGTNRTTLPTQIVFQQLLAGNFYVQRLAPIMPLSWASNYAVEWDSIEFGLNLPNVMPEEGRTRIGGWRYDSQQATVQRWGLGARFGHDFLLTPRGMMLARGVLDQLNVSIEEHLKLGVVRYAYSSLFLLSLLRYEICNPPLPRDKIVMGVAALGHARDFAYARMAELNEMPSADQQMQNLEFNRDFFGVLQFRENAIPLLLNYVRETMRAYGGEYDVALMHFTYTTLLNERLTEYSRNGPGNNAAFNAIISSPHRLGEAGGVEAFLVQEFAQGRGKRPLDLLRRTIVTGEAYCMFDHFRNYCGNDYSQYTTEGRSIMIMNGDGFNDSRAIISLETALRATGAWDADGKLIGPNHPSMTYSDPTKSKLCSFWYRDSAGSTEAIKVFGQQHPDFFSSTSLLNLARAVAARIPNIHHHAVEAAMNTIIGALTYMAEKAPAPALITAITTNDTVLPVPARANDYGDLPYGAASGAGLRLIANAVRAGDAAIANYNAERMKAVAAAVETVRDYLIPHLRAVLGPNNALLAVIRNGETQRLPDDEFDGFINNALSPHLAPIYLASRAAVNPGVTSSNAPEARIDVAVATLANVLERIQRNLTGRLVRVRDLTRAGDSAALLNVSAAAPADVVVPPAAGIGARIAVVGALDTVANIGRNADGIVFDPVQPNSPQAVLSTLAAFKATLPGDSIARAMPDTRFSQSALPGADRRFLFGLAGVGGDSDEQTLSRAMESLAKITMIFNIKPRYVDAATARSAAAGRAVILTLVAAIAKGDTPIATAQSVNRLVEALSAGALVLNESTAAAVQTINLNLVNAAIDQIYAAGQGGIFAKLNTPTGSTARTAENIKALVAQVHERAANEVTTQVAERLVGAPEAGDRNPRDFRSGTPVLRGKASVLIKTLANLDGSWTIGRPGTQQPLTDVRELQTLKEKVARGEVIPGYADTAESSGAGAMPAVATRNNKLPKVSLGLVGQPGGLPAIPPPAPMEVDTVPAQPTAGGRSRYAQRAPSNTGVNAAPLVQQRSYTDSLANGGYDFVTQEFALNWEAINQTIGNRMLAAIARCFLGTPTDLANIRAMLAGHVPVPFTVLLARPFIVMHSYAMYLLKAGTSTMMTIFGQANTTWGNDISHQVYELNVTFKSRTIVTQPKNIWQVNNSFICGLSGGFGVQFFTPDTLKAYLDSGNVETPHQSIVAILEPYEPYVDGMIPAYFSLTGSFSNVSVINQFRDDSETNTARHYYNVAFACKRWGFATYAQAALYSDAEQKSFNQLVSDRDAFFSRIDFLVWAGQSLHYNPKTGGFTFKRPSRGLLPDDRVGPGLITGLRKFTKEIPKQLHAGLVDI